MNNKIIAVWGNPASGKTVISVKLAKELAGKGKNVIIILADIFCPVISTIIPDCDPKSRTLGSLLSKPAIKREDILSKIIEFPKTKRIAVLGYKNGDNIFTYSDYLRERVDMLFREMRTITDHIIIDCSSVLTEDGFSTIALESADKVIRLCGAELKAYSYFTSHLPLLAERKFTTEKHIKILSNVKDGQETHSFKSVYGDVRYTLPHAAELEAQFFSANLLSNLQGKQGKAYNDVIKGITREVFAIE